MDAQYTLAKALRQGKVLWLNLADESALQAFRDQHANKDLLISTWSSALPELDARRNNSLYFAIKSSHAEQVKKHALEVCYYLAENACIPQECLELVLDGSTLGPSPAVDVHQLPHISREKKTQGQDSAAVEPSAATLATMVILVPPIVLGAETRLMPSLNYHLARQMARDGVEGLDLDVYGTGFMRLANSINTTTNRYVISLSMKELLYLNFEAILELAREPREQDAWTVSYSVPETGEWFQERLQNEKRHHAKQRNLRDKMQQHGWQIPPCIKRIQWETLSTSEALEACRIITPWYALIQAAEDEIWQHVLRIDRRHSIRDYPRLRAIITFGRKHPGFVGCEHPLLQRFCPAGQCFMTELLDQINQPFLFENR